jgi:hypothetical protein
VNSWYRGGIQQKGGGQVKIERSRENLRGQVIAVTGAVALGLSPTAAGVGRMPVIDQDPPGQTETATFALG